MNCGQIKPGGITGAVFHFGQGRFVPRAFFAGFAQPGNSGRSDISVNHDLYLTGIKK